MSPLGILLRILIALFLLRLAVRFVANLLIGLRPGPAPATPTLVRDRVCNTFVPRDRALRATVGGREEHFCSAACRDRARALPLPS
jgi:hypothetical protein